MLTKLKVHNYALIESLDIDLRNGLTVITGETGSGKSIIMGALSLIAGQRADTKVISRGAKKCVIEAEFVVAGYGLQDIYEQIDVDYEDITTVRREVMDTGKSRAFINDTPCSLGAMKLLVSRLIDIHSQHANLLLNDFNFQVGILDSYADTKVEINAYKEAFAEYNTVKMEYDEFVRKSEDMLKEKDYYEFQYNQLEEANLVEGEQSELEQENQRLDHAEEIKTEFYTARELMGGESGGISSLLRTAIASVNKVSEYVEGGSEMVERLESILIETKDLEGEFSNIAESMEFDQQRKQYVADRLDVIYGLQQKHRVDSLEELIRIREDYGEKLAGILDYDEDVERLREMVECKREELDARASSLSEKRKSVISDIENLLVSKLQFLGIDNAKCLVNVEKTVSYQANGIDDVSILFSANKNSEVQKIATIASGGEMSRVMLCLKSIVATKQLLSTIVFDEIDTGISGEVAGKMGDMMRDISKTMQVITISHLPQIASKAKCHFKVYKEDVEDRTLSSIVELREEGRLMEIAEMLSGKNPNQSAIDNAKSLLMQ